MPYSPPVFPLLKTNTVNLDSSYSTFIGRYSITDLAHAGSSSIATSFMGTPSEQGRSSYDIIRQRITDNVSNCPDTQRQTVCDVFKQLIAELDSNEDQSDAKKKHYTLILLGALLHRYFRIIKEYKKFDTYTGGFSSGVFASTPLSSGLFKAVRVALALPRVKDDSYKRIDLEKLDVLTIINSLLAFQQHMLLFLPKKNIARYETYAHFKNDPNFERHLQAIINEHIERDANKKKPSKSVVHQFDAIYFIQSLTTQVDEELTQLDSALNVLKGVFEEDDEDFQDLSITAIENDIKASKLADPMKEKILDLLYTPHVKEQIGQLDENGFIEQIKNAASSRASFIVLGGYCLLLESPGVSDSLKSCIKKALNSSIDNPITNDVRHAAVKLFGSFLESNPELLLKCGFFGGLDGMKSYRMRLENSLGENMSAAPAPA